MKKLQGKLTYANVVATLALAIAIGGTSAFAATQLAKNSVGTKQLKNNAVTTAKIKKQAITATKVKNETLTGKQINASTLGTVPTANQARAADTANSLAPAEGWHEIGLPGEPAFENSWHNFGGAFSTAAFYKDHEGIIHLRGTVTGGTGAVFQLPPGDRPAQRLTFPVYCSGGGCATSGDGYADVWGPNPSPEQAGAVEILGENSSLNGISFRAET